MRVKGLTDETGSKALQYPEMVERGRPYREWHRSLPNGRRLYATDIDQIEWRHRDGKLIPVAVIETTMASEGVTVNEVYLGSVLWRFQERDMQGQAALHVATALGVSAYIVVHRHDLSLFWVYNLTTDKRVWRELSPAQYERWIKRL